MVKRAFSTKTKDWNVVFYHNNSYLFVVCSKLVESVIRALRYYLHIYFIAYTIDCTLTKVQCPQNITISITIFEESLQNRLCIGAHCLPTLYNLNNSNGFKNHCIEFNYIGQATLICFTVWLSFLISVFIFFLLFHAYYV